jgi:uncharacterized protein
LIPHHIIGIDYGAKLSGNTAIAYVLNEELKIISCQAKKDADVFILEFINKNKVKIVMLDAPLSLPKAFEDANLYSDFFYRQCDKETNAMSPMFLGGLTARAMNLKHQLSKKSIDILETYPTALCKHLNIRRDKSFDGVKTMFSQIISLMKEISINIEPENIHELDAVLALFSGIRYFNKEHITIGNVKEGLIII